jgi:replicative DNA helicase
MLPSPAPVPYVRRMNHPLDISPLTRLLRRVDRTADGESPTDVVATGFPSLDKLLGGGLRRGDLTVLGGDVGSGKSALALAIALRVARAGRRATFLTGESRAERVLERALAAEGRTSVESLRLGALADEERAAVGAAAVRLRDALPVIDTVEERGAADLRTLFDDGIEPPAELVVLDGLQMLAPGARDLNEELATSVLTLKRLAVESDSAVLLTSQLPTFDARRAELRPHLDDFGALGAVKQHADVVLGVFREAMYPGGAGAGGAVELHVLKQRDGATGYVDLYFYEHWLRFEDLVEPGEPPARAR